MRDYVASTHMIQQKKRDLAWWMGKRQTVKPLAFFLDLVMLLSFFGLGLTSSIRLTMSDLRAI